MNPFLAGSTAYRIHTHPFSTNSTREFARILHLPYTHFTIHYLCLIYIHPKSLLLQSPNPLHESPPQFRPRFCQQHQVICIEQLPWQTYFEIVSYGLHYYVKQDRTKYRSLMYPNLDLKTFTCSPFILTDVVTPSYMLLIKLTSHSSTPTCLRAHHTTSRGTLSNAFSKSTKAIHNSFCFPRNFSWTCRTIKIASVVPFPGLNTNCISSNFTIFLTRASITLSTTFKHDQAALFLYMSCIQEHSPFLYTHLPSNFFFNQPVFHHYSQLRCKYPSPISPPTPPPLSTCPPLHLMALQLCHSLP